jgi:hypothetical protein
MKTLLCAVAIATLVPSARIAAQRAEPIGQSILAAEVRAQQEVSVLSRFAPDQRVRLEGILGDARRRGLPTQPLTDRMLDGKSRGQPEADIVTGTGEVLRRLEISGRALTHAGRDRIDPQEIVLGAAILDRGATSAQLESVIRTAAPTRPLMVALDVVVRLTDKGLSVDSAIAQVSGKLVSKASDSQIRGLLSGQLQGASSQ